VPVEAKPLFRPDVLRDYLAALDAAVRKARPVVSKPSEFISKDCVKMEL